MSLKRIREIADALEVIFPDRPFLANILAEAVISGRFLVCLSYKNMKGGLDHHAVTENFAWDDLPLAKAEITKNVENLIKENKTKTG